MADQTELGNLARLPREIRLQILGFCLKDELCFRVTEPNSLYESGNYDVWEPCGLLQASQALASDAAAVLPKKDVLRIIVDSRGWTTNYLPSNSLRCLEGTDSTRFAEVELVLMAVPWDDEGQFLLLRHNVMKVIKIIRRSQMAIPTQVVLKDHENHEDHEYYEWTHYCLYDETSRTASSMRPDRELAILTVLWPLMSHHSLQPSLWRRDDDCQTRIMASDLNCRYCQRERKITRNSSSIECLYDPRRARRLLNCQIRDVIEFDICLDSMKGPTAVQLRQDRRVHWDDYVKRIFAIFGRDHGEPDREPASLRFPWLKTRLEKMKCSEDCQVAPDGKTHCGGKDCSAKWKSISAPGADECAAHFRARLSQDHTLPIS